MASEWAAAGIAEFSVSDIEKGSHKVLDRSPFVIRRAVADWPACTKWTGDAGIDRLDSLAGHEHVQVMVSESGVYHGDLGQRNLETMPFRSFLQAAQQAADGRPAQHLYLAQATITDAGQADGRGVPGGLHALTADFDVRQLLAWLTAEDAHSTNLWMQQRAGSSSLHYDPFENLLCVVCGSKTVRCCSPEATPGVYPMPLWGESANHSSVSVAAPDLARHPRYTSSLATIQTAALQAGDAIFIPEGWWHQIDSAAGTIAVNIWWRSTFCRLLGSHMDSYYMRRALQSLTDAQKARLLTRPYVMTSPAEQRHGGASQAEAADQGRRREQRCPEQQRSEGDDCDPQRGGTQPPRGYVPAQYTSSASWAEAKSDSNMDEHHSAKRPRSENIPSQAEPGWQVGSLWGAWGHLQRFASLPAQDLIDELGSMLRVRSEQLRALLMDHQSPAVAELLTSKMEERAAQDNGRHEGEVQELMGDLYSVAGDTSAMMNCLVEQKEAFAREACMAALLDATGIAAI